MAQLWSDYTLSPTVWGIKSADIIDQSDPTRWGREGNRQTIITIIYLGDVEDNVNANKCIHFMQIDGRNQFNCLSSQGKVQDLSRFRFTVTRWLAVEV